VSQYQPGSTQGRLPKEQRISDAIAFHDELAPQWESNYRSRAFLSRIEAFESALDEPNVRGKRWLDVGCGSGTLTRWLSGRGATVVGVDGAPEMVHIAEAAAQTQACGDGSLQFQVANVENLPFPDGSFDGVLCSSVLEYTKDPKSCLNEIARITKPGGILMISVPNAKSIVRLGLRVAFHLTRWTGSPRPAYMAHSRHQYSMAQFSAFLKSLNFEPDSVTAFGSGFPAGLRKFSWFQRLLLFRATKSGL
jgi:2-polyprenyl-6-hydroxyphenyl methylase/3-demethylubiquinone-9 3-methyltransferase